MDDPLVTSVVEVDKIFLEIRREGRCIDGVTVILGRDGTFPRREIHGRDVMSAIAVRHFDGFCASGEGQELVAHADGHDGHLGGGHDFLEVLDGGGGMGRVARTVAEEDTIEILDDCAC